MKTRFEIEHENFISEVHELLAKYELPGAKLKSLSFTTDCQQVCTVVTDPVTGKPIGTNCVCI